MYNPPMRDERPGTSHVLDVHDYQIASAPGQPAGIFWVDGQILMAAHDSPREAVLLARGAILVGTLRFEPDPLEASHPGRDVRRISTADARAMMQRSHN